MGMNHAWFTYPFHSSANAVWRIRTSKSFPTYRLATGYITILSIRLGASQYTAIYQEAYVFTQGRSSPRLLLENWQSRIRTHEVTWTSDLQSDCFIHLHIHQRRRCVFTELSSPIKQVPWFFHVYTHYCAHVRLQLITASSPQRYWVGFHLIG